MILLRDFQSPPSRYRVGIAYAALARVPPEIGLYAAIFPLFAYALFGYSGDAVEFFPKLVAFANGVDQAHLPTLILGLGLLALLVVIRYLSPKLPSALVVVILGIVLVSMLNLESRGVLVLGNVPAGLPSLHFAMPTLPA